MEMTKIVNICDRINSCSSIAEIEKTKKEIISELDNEHKNKMNKFNEIKARHESELDTISEEIKKYIASKDFDKVSELIKKQALITAEQNMEMLSIMK